MSNLMNRMVIRQAEIPLDPIRMQFLAEVRSELMKIGHLSMQEAEKWMKKKHVAEKIQQNEMFLHEPPAYHAFAVLFQEKGPWIEKYEEYMMQHH